MPAFKSRIIRSRSQLAAQDGSAPPQAVEARNAEDTSCWANMPQELSREVLMRIEESENSWPPRKSVVACSGVCRTWRHIIKDLVTSLNSPASSLFQFPSSSANTDWPLVLQTTLCGIIMPGPRDFVLRCLVKRCRSTQTYYLYLNTTKALRDEGKFLLAARKCRRPTFTDYIISLHADDMSKGRSTYVGKLRSNFLGTKFTVFDGQPPHAGAKMKKGRSTTLVNLKQVSPRVPAGNYPVAHISYEMNVLGSRGPRRMHCAMDAIPATAVEPGGVAPTQTFSHHSLDAFPSLSFFRSKSIRAENNFLSGPLPDQKDGVLVLKNKAPRWHEQLRCWILHFNGRVTVASVKNFQLVASPKNKPAGPQHEKIILQFGKVGKDLFTMDYRYPISAFQAFAICLSSFGTKIACE